MMIGRSCKNAKITDLRKHNLRGEILHDLKNFEKNFLILIVLYNNNLGLIFDLTTTNYSLRNNLLLKCCIVGKFFSLNFLKI